MTISLFWELAINCVSDMNYYLLMKEVTVDTFFPVALYGDTQKVGHGLR